MLHEDLRRDRWHGGQLMAFSALDGTTDYKLSLAGRTSFSTPGIEIKFPADCVLSIQLPAEGEFEVAGDCFWMKTKQGTARGAFLDARSLLVEGPCTVASKADAISVRTVNNRTLVTCGGEGDQSALKADLDEVIARRIKWLKDRHIPEGLSPVARRTLVKALSVMKTQVYSPEGRIRHRWTTPDRWPHKNMWLWDSAFHAIGWRHVDAGLARDALSAVMDMQAPDGMVSLMMTPESILNQITQPPVLALAAKMAHASEPRMEWLEEMYPKLCAYVEWDMANRDLDKDGLVEWQISGNPRCRSGESGMDNSPRFDEATSMAAVDFNSFLALEYELLAEFAATLGREADEARWKEQHARLCRLISKRLWSPKHGFFLDYDTERQAHCPVLASSGFMPLICGAATAAQAGALARHLRNPATFGTPLPVPSVAAGDAEHYSPDMWRGPVWVNLNWLVAFGFKRYGRRKVAAKLVEQTVGAIEENCERYGSLYEFFDARNETPPPQLLRKGKCAPEESPYHQVFKDYGWTATLYADFVYAREKVALDEMP